MELFGKYEVGRLLGCGAFAKVYHGRNVATGQSVAIKVILKKKISGTNLINNIKREISIMRRLRHPHIVRLFEVLASKSKIFFILEYIKGGELFAKVAKARFSEDLSRKYFQQLISAVGYCHSRGVFHRDLKPENLLLDENGDLKVSDFGLSAAISPSDLDSPSILRTLCGTPAYVAPEILAKKGYHGAKVDVWSCGVVLFVLTAGYLPFNDPNLMAMYKKIYKGDYKCPKWMSPDLKRFLSGLLDINPATRITIDHITRDPWFTHSNSSSFSFSFYDNDYYCDDDASDKEEEPQQQQPLLLEGSSRDTPTSTITNTNTPSLNAFDLISFSSGLDLSGLFDQSFNPIVDGDRFVSAEPAHKIFETIEQVAKAEIAGLSLNKKKACSLDLLGPKGHFVAKVEIRPLMDNLVVVEVMKKAGDSESYHNLWKNKVRPLLSQLVYNNSDSPTPAPTTPTPVTETSPTPAHTAHDSAVAC